MNVSQSRGMFAVVFMTIATGTSFYVLLSVVPLYANANGAGGLGAGFTTGVLMLATVVAEVFAPVMPFHFGYRKVLAVAFMLLGLPAFVLPATTTLPAILGVCVLRGAVLAIAFVATGALVALLVPTDRRGEGLAIMGVATLAPSVLALPLGVWLARTIGFPPVFVSAGAQHWSRWGRLPCCQTSPRAARVSLEPARFYGILPSSGPRWSFSGPPSLAVRS